MDAVTLSRYFAMTPRAYARLVIGTLGGLLAALLLVRFALLPDLSDRFLSVMLVGTAWVLMSYRFVLPFAYAWRLRSRRSFWILLAAWVYLAAVLGLTAGAAFDGRVVAPLLMTVPLFFLGHLVVSLTSLPPELLRARYSLRSGDLAMCRAQLERVFARVPDCTEALLLRAELEFQSGNVPEARECYRSALALDPWNASVHSGLGSLHYSEGEFEEAREAFARARECQPGSAVHEYHLGLALRLTDRLWEALEHLRNAIEYGLRPELACYAFYASGQVLERLELGADVDPYYRRASALASGPVLEFWRGILAKSRLVHRVELRRFLSLISAADKPEPPPAEEDVF